MDRFDLSSFYGRSLVLMLGLTVFSCSGGGGCSSCEGCGVTPIRGGYPTGERIANSAQVRLTSSGIGFIEDNIAGVVATFLPDGLDFDIPRTTQSIGIGSITICPDSNCRAHLEIDALDLNPVAPNELDAHLRLILDSRDLAGGRARIEIDVPGTTCEADLDTRDGGREFVGLIAKIAFADTTQPARLNYTHVEVASVALAPGEDIENDDLDIRAESCSGLGCLNPARALCSIANLDAIKGILLDQLTSQISDLANGAISDQLCQTHGEYGCPDGTFSVPDSNPDSVCRFGPAEEDECVPILLGMDGEGDLGGTLLGGFSPGTHAYAQFLLAAGGNDPAMGGAGEAVNGGMTLNFFGGFRGTDRTFNTTPAHHSCVPTIPPPPRPTIPELAAFRGNVIPGTTTETHVGFGIAEAYMDYAGYGMFDSGMLCLGAGTRLSQQLSTGLVSALIRSLSDLTFPEGDSPITIAIRPQTAPDFTIGAGTEGDPLLQIALNQLQMDFYVWSTERYIRFMTFQTDLTIGIDLSVEGNQLVPTIRYVSSTNSSVTNSELLSEQPSALASTLETVIGSFAGMLTSGISPFDLPEIMGFELQVPAGGITRVREGEHNFLGIFANLALASAPYTAPVETTLTVSDLSLDRESMDPEHWNQGEGNHVWLHFGAEGPLAVEFEYSYRIDGGPWSAWTTDQRVLVEDDILLLQARHEIEGRARVVGEPASTDESPVVAELLVDILPPTLHVARTAEGVTVRANDVITPSDVLEVRYQVDGEWTDWGRVFTLDVPHDDADVVVEVRDEAGNVGRSQSALIRGLPNANVEGCGCSAPGSNGGSTPIALIGLLGLLGLVVARRRGRPSPVFFLTGALALFASGCNCGGPVTPPEPCGGECTAARPPGNTAGDICCPSTDMCVDYDLADLCDPGYECDIDNVVVDDASCGVSCSDCTVRPALEPGILATHLDSVLDSSGTVHISGYSPGDPAGNDLYGDLVFGTWNGTEVEWEIVDGAPTMPITNNPAGYRDGVSDPGDDVGRFTSIAMAGETFLISYYDVTNGALKLATGGPGGWDTHTVDDQGDSGRYSSLVITPAGVPVIAYLRIEASTATPGQVDSSVMVATANIASPAGPTDWTITQVATGPMACRPEYCEAGTTCLASGQCVTPTSDCADSCGSGNACFNGSCSETIPRGFVEDLPPALGLYTSLAVDPTGGLALVYYDRSAGNVHGVRFDGAAWGTPFLIDGYGAMQDFVGDCGMGADVAVDSAGLWHVAYIDGTEETLRYAQVQSTGALVDDPEVVDDGSTLDGATRHTDGRHIVGDDASIVVLEGGAVRIAYQDSTIQDLVVAVRPPGGGAWAIAHVDRDGSTGYWVDQEVFGTTSYLTTWWRAREGRTTSNGIRVLMAE